MNKDFDIENDNELNENTPNLDRAGSKNPFKSSEDYFESFASKLQNRINNIEEITEEAPILSLIPKYNPFAVPVNYFEELPTIIQERCIQNRASKTLGEWLLILIKPRFAVPALAVIIAAFISIHYLNPNIPESKMQVAEEFSIDEQLQSIDEETIIDALTADASVGKETPEDAEHNNIVNYLLDNNVDETNLNNEL